MKNAIATPEEVQKKTEYFDFSQFDFSKMTADDVRRLMRACMNYSAAYEAQDHDEARRHGGTVRQLATGFSRKCRRAPAAAPAQIDRPVSPHVAR